ncbi:MAG: hypothetical protein WBP61_11405 [Nocardioides sp.]
MEEMHLRLARIWLALTAPRARDERGDVPGWVMITVMTVGLVVMITALAQTQLQQMLNAAFNQVK